jgi:hypothetical protein
MKKFNVSILALVVFFFGGICSAEEFTLEEAVAAWSFAKGDWTVTGPEDEVEMTIRVAPSKAALVAQSKDVLHVLGWDPKTKLLEVQSFMADGTRGKALYDRTADRELTIKACTMVDAEGKEVGLSGKFTIVDSNTFHFTLDHGSKWVFKRKKPN